MDSKSLRAYECRMLRSPSPFANDQFLYLSLQTQRGAVDVGRWDPHAFGVSVAVTLTDSKFRLFTSDDLNELTALLRKARCVVGYNIRSFDFSVIEGACGADLREVQTLDLLMELETATGLRPSLGSICAATLGSAPSMDSLACVSHSKAGNLPKLFEASCNEAYALKSVHTLGRETGRVCYHVGDSRAPHSIAVNW